MKYQIEVIKSLTPLPEKMLKIKKLRNLGIYTQSAESCRRFIDSEDVLFSTDEEVAKKAIEILGNENLNVEIKDDDGKVTTFYMGRKSGNNMDELKYPSFPTPEEINEAEKWYNSLSDQEKKYFEALMPKPAYC